MDSRQINKVPPIASLYLVQFQGVMQFAMAIKAHDSDPEIASLADQMKQQFMPKVAASLPVMQPPNQN
jgi:hypothetical protein